MTTCSLDTDPQISCLTSVILRFPSQWNIKYRCCGFAQGLYDVVWIFVSCSGQILSTSPASALISLFQFPLKSLNQSFLWPLYLWNTEWPQVQQMLQWETKPTGTNEERSQQFKDRAALRRCKVGPDQLCSFCVAAELGRWAKHELQPCHSMPVIQLPWIKYGRQSHES